MAFTHYQQIRDQELPSMEIDNVKAFLKDFSVSEDTDKPITLRPFPTRGRRVTGIHLYLS